MRSIVAVVGALLALTSYVDAQRLLSEQGYAKEFTGWITIHNITYSQDILETKFNTYKSNYDYVAEHNRRFAEGLEDYECALNTLADISPEEYRTRHLKQGFAPPKAEAYTPLVTQDVYDPACDYPNSCPAPSPAPSTRSSTGGRVPVPSSSSGRVPSWQSSSTDRNGRSSSSSSSSSTGSSRSSSSSSSSSEKAPSSSTGSASSSGSSSSGSFNGSSSTGSSFNSSSSTGSSGNSSSSTGSGDHNNTTKDWRDSGFIGAVKDQGSCGACWAFASTQSMQSAWAQKTGNLLTFSDQEMIDCSEDGQGACDMGGIQEYVWRYLGLTERETKSAKRSPVTQEKYPYEESSGKSCRWSASKASDAVFTKYVKIPEGDEDALKAAVDIVPAVAIAINSGSTGFMFYKSGVLNDRSCSGGMFDMTHAVAVVGYGTDEATGFDYWLIKNSWSSTWGIDGYMKLRRNAGNMCGVATWASYVVA